MNEENGKSARQYLNNAATAAKTAAHIATGNAAGVGKEVLQNPHFFGSLLFYLIIVPILIVVIVVLYFMHLPASLFDTYESITEYEVAYENYQNEVKKINGAFQKRYQELIQKGQENAQKEFAKQLEAYHAEPGGLIVKKQTPFPNDKVIVGALNILCMHAIKTDSWELTTPWALQLAVKAAVPLAMYLDEPIIEVELVPLYSEEEEGTETVIYQLFMTYTYVIEYKGDPFFKNIFFRLDDEQYARALEMAENMRLTFGDIDAGPDADDSNESGDIADAVEPDPDHPLEHDGLFSSPFPGWHWKTAISSYYGPRDIYPYNHSGIDIAAGAGTSAKAIADGEVIDVTTTGAYGNKVMIYHGLDQNGNKIVSLYAHGSSISVTKGQKVRAGDEVIKVGQTGNATGNHLHLEIRINGNTVNPLPLVPD